MVRGNTNASWMVTRGDILWMTLPLVYVFHEQPVICFGLCLLRFISVFCYASVSVYLLLRVRF